MLLVLRRRSLQRQRDIALRIELWLSSCPPAAVAAQPQAQPQPHLAALAPLEALVRYGE